MTKSELLEFVQDCEGLSEDLQSYLSGVYIAIRDGEDKEAKHATSQAVGQLGRIAKAIETIQNEIP